MHKLFFFQAEDGIRDIGVTGVQTCALPISLTLSVPKPMLPTAGVPFLAHLLSRIRAAGVRRGVLGTSYRSAERRVGKECRSRWSPYHHKKKQSFIRSCNRLFIYFS